MEQRWLPFLRALEGAFAKRKSGELAGIKLLLTTLLSFPAASLPRRGPERPVLTL